MKKCPSCKGRGKVMEMLRYAVPPLGTEVFAASGPGKGKLAWPLRERESFEVVKVKSIRSCCRCGGRGELLAVVL